MKIKRFIFCSLLLLSSSLFAINTCTPSGSCDTTAADLETAEPVYYPPLNPDGGPTNTQVEVQEAPDPAPTSE